MSPVEPHGPLARQPHHTPTRKAVTGMLGRFALVVLAACAAIVLAAPGVASAAFTRPFERQISGVGVPGGVATDSENHLWVGDLNAGLLREFEPAGVGNTPLGTPFATGVLPGSVAAQSATAGNGLLYVTAPERKSVVEMYEPNGTHVGSWGSFEKPYLAVDNNPASDVAESVAVYGWGVHGVCVVCDGDREAQLDGQRRGVCQRQ